MALRAGSNWDLTSVNTNLLNHVSNDLVDQLEAFFHAHVKSYRPNTFLNEWRAILKHQIPEVAVKSSRIIDELTRKVRIQHPSIPKVKPEDIGNAAHLNPNTKTLVLQKNADGQHDFYGSLSIQLYGSANGGCILKWLTVMEILNTPATFEKLLKLNSSFPNEIVEGLRRGTPLPPCVQLLSNALKCDIFVHLGAVDTTYRTFRFSSVQAKQYNLHTIYIDGEFFPLFPENSPKKTFTCLYVSSQLIQSTSANKFSSNNLGLESAVNNLLEKCAFCKYFGLLCCAHVLQCHVEGKNEIGNHVMSPTLITSSKYHRNEINNVHFPWLKVTNGVRIVIPEKENSFFASVSHFLNGQADLAMALRKCVIAEYVENQGNYKKMLDELGSYGPGCENLRKCILSMQNPGDDSAAAILSVVLQRPIVVFAANSTNAGRVISLASNTINAYPIVLVKVNEIYFEPLIPTEWSNFHTGRVRDELMKIRASIFERRQKKFGADINEFCLIKNGRLTREFSDFPGASSVLPPLPPLPTANVPATAAASSVLRPLPPLRTAIVSSTASAALPTAIVTATAAASATLPPSLLPTPIVLPATAASATPPQAPIPTAIAPATSPEPTELLQNFSLSALSTPTTATTPSVKASFVENVESAPAKITPSTSSSAATTVAAGSSDQKNKDANVNLTKCREAIFIDIIKCELQAAGKLNRAGIAKFVVRSSREVKFWKSALTIRRPKSKAPNEEWAVQFAIVQRKQGGRDLVADILRNLGYGEELIDEYYRLAEIEFSQKPGTYTYKRVGGKPRDYPEYSSEDLAN